MKRVLVASIPRCGSTMVFRAIAGLGKGSTMPQDYAGPHCKTHSFEPDAFAGKVDVAIFLFGDVLSSVASTRLRRYTQAHFDNCGAGHLSPESVDIFDADHLNYERMFDAWMQRTAVPHVCVRYERLHALAPVVSRMIAAPLPLVEHRRRRTRHDVIDPKDRRRIRRSYASLIGKVTAAPDLSCWL
jgi:hypothetical protein